MSYSYRCSKGHSQGVWPDHDRAGALRAGKEPWIRRCDCGRTRRLTHTGSRRYGFQFIPDVPEHFNESIGENGSHVRGRRHLQILQKQHNVQDYDKLQHPKGGWQGEPKKARERSEKAATLGARRMEEANRRGEDWASDSEGREVG